MSRRCSLSVLVIAALAFGFTERILMACPFCAAVSQTFSEEIGSMDAVVIARMAELPQKSAATSDANDEVPKAKFEIEQVIKGQSLLDGGSSIETIFFGEAEMGQAFLVMGVDPPNLMWSTPLQLSERGRTYVSQLMSLPEKGAERLMFFQDFLEDEDEMLARDAYDEFAKAPYDEVKDLKSHMHHDQLIKWIQSPDVPASRRRLYLTMLGVCGSHDDLPMIEEMLKSNDRKTKAGLDAMIGCYLTLKGPDGMPLVEDLFLKNDKAEYADTYAAIMALRFHGDQADIISRQRVLEGLRYMLDRPQLADLVIPDLAKWEDWSVMDKLVQLFKDADDKSSWVRVPVINYLRACPLAESKELISELEKIDPAAVKRAQTFFPFGPTTDSDDEEKSSSWQRPAKEQFVSKQDEPASIEPLVPAPRDGEAVAAARSTRLQGSKEPLPATKLPVVLADRSTNPFLILCVAILAGGGLFLMLWAILRGAGGPASA